MQVLPKENQALDQRVAPAIPLTHVPCVNVRNYGLRKTGSSLNGLQEGQIQSPVLQNLPSTSQVKTFLVAGAQLHAEDNG